MYATTQTHAHIAISAAAVTGTCHLTECRCSAVHTSTWRGVGLQAKAAPVLDTSLQILSRKVQAYHLHWLCRSITQCCLGKAWYSFAPNRAKCMSCHVACGCAAIKPGAHSNSRIDVLLLPRHFGAVAAKPCTGALKGGCTPWGHHRATV